MKEKREYFEENKKVGEFGIPYLDDKLYGICRSDLILIGARSGAGKSTLAKLIALHNTINGRKVRLLSLENFDSDDFYSEVYYLYKAYTRDRKLSMREFVAGGLPADERSLENAIRDTKAKFKGLDVIGRQSNFGIDKVKDAIAQAGNEGYDLVILDHLDYVDKDSNSSEVSQVTELMKTIREAQEKFKIAVVAFSHLRKPLNSANMPAVPSIDEFIGSSNKVKEATVVIMVAPDDKWNEEHADDEENKATWFAIRKLRMGGIDNRCGRLFFNRRNGTYVTAYEEHSVSYNGEVGEIC